MSYFKTITTTLLLISISGCSAYGTHMIQHRGQDYLSAKTAPPLTLPAGTQASGIKPRFAVPPQRGVAPTHTLDLTPPGL